LAFGDVGCRHGGGFVLGQASQAGLLDARYEHPQLQQHEAGCDRLMCPDSGIPKAMRTVVLEPGAGEAVSQSARRLVLIKTGLAEFVLTESRYATGEAGPAPHIHREHSDCFFLLAGSLTFGLANQEIAASAGDFVLVPPGVVHTFRNERPAEAHFLNIHAPGKGFDRHLIEMRDAEDPSEEAASAERFDTFDPPAGGGRPASDALVSPAGSGKVVALGDATVVARTGASDAGGALCLHEIAIQPGSRGLTARSHTCFVTGLWFLEGSTTLELEEREVHASPGSYVLVPPGIVHAISGEGGASPVRLLGLMAPTSRK
jgi:mannose-6-phosphate isomerase-like protein (cupin superfamily)